MIENNTYVYVKEGKHITMTGYINYIRKTYGVYIDFDIIEDPCMSPDYMTVKITASTSKYGGKEVNYKFQTTSITESYLKKKIMEVVGLLNDTVFIDSNYFTPPGNSFSGIVTASKISSFSFHMDYRHQIKKVIFNNPATIIFWEDGSKTVVKCQPDDKYDKMTGFAMACTKYMFGNEGNYYEVFKKWVVEEE